MDLQLVQRLRTLPVQGRRLYFTLQGARTAEDAVWSYEDPFDEVAVIKDRLRLLSRPCGRDNHGISDGISTASRTAQGIDRVRAMPDTEQACLFVGQRRASATLYFA